MQLNIDAQSTGNELVMKSDCSRVLLPDSDMSRSTFLSRLQVDLCRVTHDIKTYAADTDDHNPYYAGFNCPKELQDYAWLVLHDLLQSNFDLVWEKEYIKDTMYIYYKKHSNTSALTITQWQNEYGYSFE